MRLALTLAHGSGETPSDFASRLSARACRDDYWKFCRDFGLQPQEIANGIPDAVVALADLAGVDADMLLTEAFAKVGQLRRYVYKGQSLHQPNLSRNRVRMCPACVDEDIKRLDCRLTARPHRRSIWVIRGIRTCARHGMALAEFGHLPGPTDTYDTTQAIASALPQLPKLVDDAPRRTPSRFERYVVDRVGGTADGSWLDSMPLYAALHLSFVVGAVARHGPGVVLDDLGNDDAWECEAAGFDIVDKGADGIRELLDELQAWFRNVRSTRGRKVLYGRLYEWLAHECADAAYDPVRDVIVEHAVDTLAFGPGDVLFGREIVTRRVHSVRSASKEFGLHPKRMRKMLHGANLTDPVTDGLADNKVTFEAEAGEVLLRNLADTMSLECVRDYLNVPRPHERGLLERGLIKPMVSGGRAKGGHCFLRRDLDDLLARLLRNADPAHAGDRDFAPLIRAAKHSCCAVMDVVKFVLDGRLERVGRDPVADGFVSVLVDMNEVRSLVVGDGVDGITMREMEKELRVTSRVVTSLIDGGFIASQTVKNPVTGWMQPVVPPEELERFRQGYVTLHALARERGEHFRHVKKKLVAMGISPVADPAELNVTLYRRADLP